MKKQIVFTVLSISLGALLFVFSLRSVIGGHASAYEAEVGVETAVCNTFPISPYEGIRSVTPPGTGVNPYPDISDFHPSSPSPPSYEDFINHQDDVPLLSAQEGTVFKVQVSGNVSGWLVWNTIYVPPTSSTLTASLIWPGNIGDYPENGYYEPDDPSDMSLDIDDWVQGNTGNMNSNSVRDALNDLIVQERILRLPIWNNMNGQGSGFRLHITSFGLFRLHGHNVTSGDSWLLLEFVGWDNYCEQVVIEGPTTGVQDTSYSFTASVSPITVTLPLTYRWEATGQTAVTHITSTLTDTISYSWPVAGTKTVTVTVNDGMETAVVSTHTIQIDTLPPTSTPTPTRGPSPTPAPTSTPSPCDIEFEGYALAGNQYVWIKGTRWVEVTIHDLTSNTLLGTDILLDRSTHACSGFADFMDDGGSGLLPPLIAGHVLVATGDDGTSDTIVVLNEPPTSTPTPTPHAPDLVVVGAPKLISTPPIAAYQPVSFTVMISNAGNMPVNNLFFIDLYFDPDPPVISTTTRIPISQSDGYTRIYSLAEQTSRVITITSSTGFQNEPSTHLVYAMVDSLENISEIDETNNISAAAILDDVEPASTPTPTPTWVTRTPTPTSTPTPPPTPIGTPPACRVRFETTPLDGQLYVLVTGDIGVNLTLYDLTDNEELGIDIIHPHPSHVCPGFADFKDSNGVGTLKPLIAGHVLSVVGDDGSYDTTIVLYPSTPTPTSTPLPTPIPCGVEFEGHLTAGNRYAWVTGDIGVTVELYDLTTSTLLGTDVMVPRPYHACAGFADFMNGGGVGLLDPLVEGHVIAMMGDDGTDDTTIVLALPPTSTPTPTPANFTYLPIITR